MLTFDEAQKQAYKIAVEHGWWEKPRDIPELLMLMVTELAEAMEHYRKPFSPAEDHTWQEYRNYPSEHYYTLDGKPDGFYIELADIIIRILDLCGHDHVDIGELVRLKMEYNRTRPYRHGGKRA